MRAACMSSRLMNLFRIGTPAGSARLLERSLHYRSRFQDPRSGFEHDVAHRIGFEHDASTTRKKVLDALSPLFLGVDDDKITVAKAVCNSPTDLDIFFELNESEKGVMVRMILEGLYFG
ncbi:PREDICTED: uncharacterized protein LOC105976104 isoform X2 [Erythranthe guttata]|uniref:uncharacterized protein LOC105969186 isoform X2 n=1 Tax=Erythranthe guttata TaxID=4155 RepID=UPI00064DF368|nr:PREDICTED: uncharacterized protein LOC105969186 isoform X2 [Erythranthe guttata]XP_012856849.1 PREDICTED: uncharacterized protein LOC105976104 isoform X2 [Erythranthe guttata]|eukprot:XP_012849387.1 PREDICTED: uncharacterized protein LOC105969186 isoform X2 [Erythranthe guttata]